MGSRVQGMRWYWEYVQAKWRATFRQWQEGEAVIGLVAYLLGLLVAAGAIFGLWEQDVGLSSIGLVAVFAVGPWFLFLFVFVTPARMWRDAQPGPFALNIGPCRIERMAAQWQHNLIAATHVVRLPVQNLGPTGMFRAYLSSHKGVSEANARVSLAWEGEAEAQIELLTVTPEWEEENPARVKVGYLSAATNRKDGKPFEFSPAYPGFPQTASHVADVILPNDDGDLTLRLRIGNQDNQWESVSITLRMTEDGLACVS